MLHFHFYQIKKYHFLDKVNFLKDWKKGKEFMNFDLTFEFLRYLPPEFKISNVHTLLFSITVPSVWKVPLATSKRAQIAAQCKGGLWLPRLQHLPQ